MRGLQKLANVKRTTPSMASALPDMPMPETAMVRLTRILSSSMTEYFEPVFRQAGLTENGFHVLCLLLATDKEQVSPSELSDLVGTSRANMTRILEQLSQEGLVSRYAVATDARRQTIRITPKGRRIATNAVPAIKNPLLSAFSNLTAEELTTLNALMRKAILSMDKGLDTVRAVG